MFEVTINRTKRVITFRASGNLTHEDMKKVYDDAVWATDGFKGTPHMVLADIRGMGAMSQESGKIFSDIIRYGREHGTICCVHLSDTSISKLQASRLAREVNPSDDCTVNVVSIDEAEKVIQEKQSEMDQKKRS
jgi:hypothetical protein